VDATDADVRWLRHAIALSQQSVAAGDYAFGAVVVSASEALLAEARQTVVLSSDPLGHAELNALRQLFPRWTRDELAGATIYSSTEPCPMCAGAIAWSLGRLVYGLSQRSMLELYAETAPRFGADWECRSVLAAVRPRMDVVGPMLESEAAKPHQMWLKRKSLQA
jgi:tRNA(Arg) A34 adenosine deaminase TadA